MRSLKKKGCSLIIFVQKTRKRYFCTEKTYTPEILL